MLLLIPPGVGELGKAVLFARSVGGGQVVHHLWTFAQVPSSKVPPRGAPLVRSAAPTEEELGDGNSFSARFMGVEYTMWGSANHDA